jgi:hypothetical protein
MNGDLGLFGPDQNPTVLFHRQPLCVHKFELQLLKARVSSSNIRPSKRQEMRFSRWSSAVASVTTSKNPIVCSRNVGECPL